MLMNQEEHVLNRVICSALLEIDVRNRQNLNLCAPNLLQVVDIEILIGTHYIVYNIVPIHCEMSDSSVHFVVVTVCRIIACALCYNYSQLLP